MQTWFKVKRWNSASSRCSRTAKSTICMFTSRGLVVMRAASSARSALLSRKTQPAADAFAESAQRRFKASAKTRRKLSARVDRAICKRPPHEVANDMQRVVGALAPVVAAQRDARIVETDPRAGHELRVHQHEPAIGVVLRRSGLARNVGTNAVNLANATAGATIDRSAQHVDQMRGEFRLHHTLRTRNAGVASVGRFFR